MAQRLTWREKFCSTSEGVCDFQANYRYYFKWLLGLFSSCIIIRGKTKTGTVDKEFLKKTVILDGAAVLVKFDGKLYGLPGYLGGAPTEYYIPSQYIVANPVLGSKAVNWRDFQNQKKDGVLICATAIDKFVANSDVAGFYDLIHQTATLLADNIVSLSCAQINTRAQNIIKAYSDTQVETAELALKKLYSGKPYTAVESDLMEDIKIEPLNAGHQTQTITKIIEANNYILSDYLKKIGVSANVVMKRERLVSDEVNAQDQFVGLAMTQMLGSMQAGFDDANEFFADDILEPFAVDLNPAIVRTLLDLIAPAQPQEPAAAPADPEEPADNPGEDQSEPQAQPQEPAGGEQQNESSEERTDADTAAEQEAEPETAEVVETRLEEQAETVEAIAQALIDEDGGESDADNES